MSFGDRAADGRPWCAGDLVLTDEFEVFLSRLLHEGRVVFRDRPAPWPASGVSAAASRVLARAFEAARLDVAGPVVAFDAAVAAEAGELVRQACWALVCRLERVEDLGRRLGMRAGASGPAAHLSADLVFRHLPQVHRRARGIDPGDPLVGLIGAVLRAWPLSGVLADLDDPPSPAVPLDFGGHPGLMLLYAERLAAHDRPAWRPPAGPAHEYFELVAPAGLLAGRGGAAAGKEWGDD